MLTSRLDDTYSGEVRSALMPLTVAKIAANSAARFAPPFVATIASGLHVSLSSVGGAIAIGELVGLGAPVVTRIAGRFRRRTAMVSGLLGIAAGAAVCSSSPGIITFAAGLAVLALAKIVFDLGVVAWLTDRIEYAKLGRAFGLTETAWAISLFVGVVLMGLLTGVTSWRWGYVLAIVATLVMAVALHRVLPDEPVRSALRALNVSGGRDRLGTGWWVVISAVTLTSSAQSIFVTFGKWLQDGFGFSDTKIAVVIFAFGAVELVAASSTVRFLDAWGKQRCALLGTGAMVPLGIGFVAVHGHMWPGLVLLAMFIGAFEFSVLAVMSMSNNLVPSNPSTGLAMTVGAATLGRAVMAPIATTAYSAHGIWLPVVIGTSCAAVTWSCNARYRALSGLGL